ncbi:MAG: leucine-rich repeat domain-containing protein [Lachnospiraceae bacterium]|nr:leucine-rich repeat domain-containing protein [Lachnospiraceae bacterium]
MNEKLRKIGIIIGIVVGVLVLVGVIGVVSLTPKFNKGNVTMMDSRLGYKYTITKEGVQIHSAYMMKTPKDGRLEIPGKIWGKPVILVRLSGLPDGVTSVHIPDSVTFFDGIYDCKNLVEITGGANIETCSNMFCCAQECDALKHVEFLEKNRLGKLNNFAQNCKSLETVTIGGEIKEIDSSAFADCASLQFITFGKNVEVVRKGAFYNCPALTSVTFLNEDVVIEEGAFAGCPWAESPEGKAFIEAHKKIAEN